LKTKIQCTVWEAVCKWAQPVSTAMANSRPLTTDCYWLVNQIEQWLNA
jgi:hypothetical protein